MGMFLQGIDAEYLNQKSFGKVNAAAAMDYWTLFQASCNTSVALANFSSEELKILESLADAQRRLYPDFDTRARHR